MNAIKQSPNRRAVKWPTLCGDARALPCDLALGCVQDQPILLSLYLYAYMNIDCIGQRLVKQLAIQIIMIYWFNSLHDLFLCFNIWVKLSIIVSCSWFTYLRLLTRFLKTFSEKSFLGVKNCYIDLVVFTNCIFKLLL